MTSRRKATRGFTASNNGGNDDNAFLSDTEQEEVVEIIENLDENDYLCLAGTSRAHHHTGNVRFQEILQEYAHNTTKETIQETALQVIDVFQTCSGRFVKVLPNGSFGALPPSSVLRVVIQALEQQARETPKRRSMRERKTVKRLEEEEGFYKPQTRRPTITPAAAKEDESDSSSSSDEEDESVDEASDVEDEEDEYMEDDTEIFHSLHKNDVLSTNGGGHVVAHPGNTRFEEMAVKFGKQYHKARTDDDRFAVVKNMIESIKGRFVKRLGNGSYKKLTRGIVIQKVTRALKRAKPKTLLPTKVSPPSTISKSSLRKRTPPTPAASTAEDTSTAEDDGDSLLLGTRSGRKRRRVSRLQDEHEAALVVTAQTSVNYSDAKPSPAELLPIPKRVSPDMVPPTSVNSIVLSTAGIPIVPKQAEMPVILGENSKPHGLAQLAQRFTKWVLVRNYAFDLLTVAVV